MIVYCRYLRDYPNSIEHPKCVSWRGEGFSKEQETATTGLRYPCRSHRGLHWRPLNPTAAKEDSQKKGRDDEIFHICGIVHAQGVVKIEPRGGPRYQNVYAYNLQSVLDKTSSCL